MELFALDVPFKMIKYIATELEFGDAFDLSVRNICEKNSRLRKYLIEVLQAINKYKMEKKPPFILLVSYTEMQFIIMS